VLNRSFRYLQWGIFSFDYGRIPLSAYVAILHHYHM